ncbi:MAG: tyrosine/serine/threonine protein phosphatase pps1 [Sclerophora amabilis]|nr:MAG: tyrosine/serine/threonine protein phosphatase pps1 [Sclerophora amabilis]
MAAVIARPPQFRQSPTPPPLPPTLSLHTSIFGPAPVPNKHLQPLSPGSPPPRAPETPPASPPTKHLSIHTSSILYPPNNHPLLSESPPVYLIDAEAFAAAVEHISSQPLPEPTQVFPWLHGLHPQNHTQSSFFAPGRRTCRGPPKCMRGVTIVKAGGDLSHSKLKGAVSPEELLPEQQGSEVLRFPEVDPKRGFSVRNFQIQVGKMATASDIVIYGDDQTRQKEVLALAKKFSRAQALLQVGDSFEGLELPSFSTFVLSGRFDKFEKSYPELIAVDSEGQGTGQVLDFFNQERLEMCSMTRASEISNNIWLGPTPGSASIAANGGGEDEDEFDIFIEASDVASLPEPQSLRRSSEDLKHNRAPQYVVFPSSGSVMPSWTESEVEGVVDMCRWMYEVANPEARRGEVHDIDELDADGDSRMNPCQSGARKILLHCTDGYTESSLLALIYFMFAECAPMHEAWLRLHCEKKRNFFAYPSDVGLLSGLQSRLLQESPKQKPGRILSEPSWLARIDGSLPSRILPYMYLGNLGHANNPELLHALGIRQVLSVGEAVSWSQETVERWGRERLLLIDRVQDNGVDPLTDQFSKCLDFIEQGQLDGTATLVHCRVGVSRSATICIAEVMKSLHMSFPRAYCFVRGRRLNVIIQPHLRFAYELLKWEETQLVKRNEPLKRELEWATIAREIALMNRPYARS